LTKRARLTFGEYFSWSFEAVRVVTTGEMKSARLSPVLIPEQAAHRFRDDAARLFRLIAARHSD
jgi:hypothetical protein